MSGIKGSYHKRKANNKPDMIFVPRMVDAENLLVPKQTFIDAVQVAYETGYKQTTNGMHLKFGEKMLEEICKRPTSCKGGEV